MIRLTREVRFSVDRDWAGRITLDPPVTNSWGGWPSAVGLVPYLCLRVTVCGAPNLRTGYLCNITEIDRCVREHAIPHAADLLRARGWRVSAEMLTRAAWDRLGSTIPSGARLEQVELATTPTLRFTMHRDDPATIRMTQQFEFSASHRLHCADLSDDENRRLFGKCNHPNGHGHNYLVDVTIEGCPSAGEDAICDLPRFELAVREGAIEVLDHKHLNLDVPQFRALNPSVENIALVVWELLEPRIKPLNLYAIRVYETAKTWAEYRGPGR